jgi:hypothetical protein
MPAKKPFVNIKHLPDDLFSYQDERFYDFVEKFIRKKQAGLLKFEEISSADIYLNCTNVLGVLKLDSAALLPLKESLCLKLDDNSFIVLPGIKSSFSYLTELLTKKKDDLARTARQGKNFSIPPTLSTITNININNTTSISNSSAHTASAISSQSDVEQSDSVKTMNRHKKHIVCSVTEWIQKNREKLGDSDLTITEGRDYHVTVTVDPALAIIRCRCGIKSTLPLVRDKYQVIGMV